MSTCADAQDCADLRYPGSRLRRLETGEDAEPCDCPCHDDFDQDDWSEGDDPNPMS